MRSLRTVTLTQRMVLFSAGCARLTGMLASRRIVTLTVLLIGMHATQAQQVQWADRIVGFSSQAGKNAYSARQALGPPSKLPGAGDCGCAWSPARVDTEWGADPNKPEYLKVGFAKPERVRQILLAENYRAGSVRRVWIYDAANTELLVYERLDKAPPPPPARLHAIEIERSPFKVSAVKVELDPEVERSPPQLDAVGIADHNKPVAIEVPLAKSYPVFGYAADLGPALNSPFAELLPRFAADGQTMYFDRKDHPENYGGFINDDIWFSQREGNGSWQPAQRAPAPLNNAYHNYVCGVSTDGVLTLYGQYSAEGIPMPGLSQSFRFQNQWSFPMNLNVRELYNAGPYAEYFISDDRRTMVMSIEDLSTEGGKDLYISFSEDQINWSKPLNLGKAVNSGGNEMSPWLSPDGKTLLFSSDAHNGYGEQDIYVSTRSGPAWTDWSAPQNLGPRVNTPAWESHYVPDPAGQYGYFARAADELGNTDLYRIALREELEEEVPLAEAVEEDYPFEGRFLLFGYVLDGSTGRSLNASLVFSLAEDSTRRVALESLNSQYKLRLDDNINYVVEVRAEGYPTLRTSLRIDDKGNTGVRRRDFKLYPAGYVPPQRGPMALEPGETFRLRTLLFRVNSPVISRESYPELTRLAEALEANPAVRIQIEGHTNSNCDKRFCDRLSESRARSVAMFLLEKGIAKDRISWVGYGKDKPVADNDTEEGRRLNQRVDIRVE